MQYSNLYLVAVARDNINAASILIFLHKLREVFVHYFNELEEESLRDNFVIAYELLDEVCLGLACKLAVQLRCCCCCHLCCMCSEQPLPLSSSMLACPCKCRLPQGQQLTGV